MIVVLLWVAVVLFWRECGLLTSSFYKLLYFNPFTNGIFISTYFLSYGTIASGVWRITSFCTGLLYFISTANVRMEFKGKLDSFNKHIWRYYTLIYCERLFKLKRTLSKKKIIIVSKAKVGTFFRANRTSCLLVKIGSDRKKTLHEIEQESNLFCGRSSSLNVTLNS